MARKVALLAAAALVATACGEEVSRRSAQLPTQQPATVTSTRIVGGTKTQRALLREVLRGLPRRRIHTIVVEPATRRHRPFVRGDVVLTMRAGHPDLRASWETWLVAGAVDFLAAKRDLPRVVWANAPDGTGGRLHWPDAPREPELGPPPASPAAVAELRRAIRAAADGAQARIVSLELLTPYGVAPALTLEVEDPAAFLNYRLERFLERWQEFELFEGSYVWIVDGGGEFVWSNAIDNRTGPGSGGIRPDLEGCGPPMSLSRGLEAPDPPPCPA